MYTEAPPGGGLHPRKGSVGLVGTDVLEVADNNDGRIPRACIQVLCTDINGTGQRGGTASTFNGTQRTGKITTLIGCHAVQHLGACTIETGPGAECGQSGLVSQRRNRLVHAASDIHGIIVL